MNLPKRKMQRLNNYNYSNNGAYFVTMCTQDNRCLFGNIDNSQITLNNAGLMVHKKIIEIPEVYSNISIDKFTVMPNHVHLIIALNNTKITDNGMTQGSFRFGFTKTLTYHR